MGIVNSFIPVATDKGNLIVDAEGNWSFDPTDKDNRNAKYTIQITTNYDRGPVREDIDVPLEVKNLILKNDDQNSPIYLKYSSLENQVDYITERISKVDLNKLNGIQIKKIIENSNGDFQLILQKTDGVSEYAILNANSQGIVDIDGDLSDTNPSLLWSTSEEISKTSPDSVFNFFDILFPGKELKLLKDVNGSYNIVSNLHGLVNLSNFSDQLEQEQLPILGDIDGEFADDQAGWSVSLSGDGSVVAIGANAHDRRKGQVRIFENSNGTWTQIGDDIDGEYRFDFAGNSVSLSADGSVVAIGALIMMVVKVR